MEGAFSYDAWSGWRGFSERLVNSACFLYIASLYKGGIEKNHATVAVLNFEFVYDFSFFFACYFGCDVDVFLES